MNPMPQGNKGFFISLEGGEGAGKSTLLRSLNQYFEDQGRHVVQTREPGGCPLSEQIRTWLLDPKSQVSEHAELFLFLAARAQHLEEVILPALRKGNVVICDRFHDSTIAYQGFARGLGFDFVKQLCEAASNNLWPDLTFYLDIDPEIGQERAKSRGEGEDRMEKEKLSFHAYVREGFLEIARLNPQRIHVLDASKSADIVYGDAKRILDATT